jgi:hypothetical protein
MPAAAETASVTARPAIPAFARPAGKTIAAAISPLILDRGVAELADPASCRDERYGPAVTAAPAIPAAAADFAIFALAAVPATASAGEWPIGTSTTAFSVASVGTGTPTAAVTAGYATKFERQIY